MNKNKNKSKNNDDNNNKNSNNIKGRGGPKGLTARNGPPGVARFGATGDNISIGGVTY